MVSDFIRLNKDPIEFFKVALNDRGRFVRLRLGFKDVYLIFDHNAIRHILQIKAHKYSKQTRGVKAMKMAFGEGLFTSEGSNWKAQREEASKAFTVDHISKLTAVKQEIVDAKVNDWALSARQGQTFDVCREISALALQISGRALFNISIKPEYIVQMDDNLNWLSQYYIRRIRRCINWPYFLPNKDNRHAWKLKSQIHCIMRNLIREVNGQHLKGDEGFCTRLLFINHGRSNTQRNEMELIGRMMTFLISGYRTVSICIIWTLYLLSRNPDIAEKLHREVSLMNDLTDMSKLGYTESVIKESLRIYPPSWLIARKSIEPDEIGGHKIAAGSTMLLSPYITHRDQQYWRTPELFNPERFSKDNERHIVPFSYFPFGGGPRHCIGKAFALQEAKIAISAIVRRFHLKLLNSEEIHVNPMFVMPPKTNIYFKLIER